MIIVNLDVMMARRKMSSGEHHAGKPVGAEDGQGEGGALLHTGGYLQSLGLPAGRYFGV